jgi:curved DNA-binding protein CbpA
MSNDYYKVLNVRPEATTDEIHKAYRTLAFRYHPDRNRTSAAQTLMATINEAYAVLADRERRSVYDRTNTKRGINIGEAVLRAARENLLKKNWKVADDRQQEVVLKDGTHRVQVFFVTFLDREVLRRCRLRSDGFSVILAFRIDPAFNIASDSMAVIDLMFSRLYGTFPDDKYKELFQPFL